MHKFIGGLTLSYKMEAIVLVLYHSYHGDNRVIKVNNFSANFLEI